jgi:hypothetical protein
MTTTPQRKERTSKSEDRTLAESDRNVVDDQRRASCADVSNKLSDPKADFFHKLVAKVTTEDDGEADRVQGSTSSLDEAKNVDVKEKTASTSSLNVDSKNVDVSVDKMDGRTSKFSEMSRSNACLETASASTVSSLKYASCFSISRMKAHNIASYNEFNQETEQVSFHKI